MNHHQEATDRTQKNNMEDPQQETQDRTPEKNNLSELNQGLSRKYPSRITQQNYRRKNIKYPQQELPVRLCLKPCDRTSWQNLA